MDHTKAGSPDGGVAMAFMRLDQRTDRELLEMFVAARRAGDPGESRLAGDAAGSGDAFAELVRRHGPMVRGVCRRAGGLAGAEDAAQVVFATLVSRAPSLLGRTSLAGWLHRATWNIARRSRRDASVRRGHEREAAAMRATAGPGETGPAAAVEREAIRVEVHRAIDALPDPYRDAIVLHHLEGYTVAQLAVLLGCPSGTVAARVSRGRHMLRERLGRRGVALPAIVLVALLAAERRAALARIRLPATVPSDPPAPPPGGWETGRATLPSWRSRTLRAGTAGGLAGSILRLGAFLFGASRRNAFLPLTGALAVASFATFASVAYLVLSSPGDGNAVSEQKTLSYEFSNDRVVYAAGVGRGGGDTEIRPGQGPWQVAVKAPGVPSGGGREAGKAKSREPEEVRESSGSNSSSSWAGENQLEVITPEPTVLPLLGLTSFGLLARRRRSGRRPMG